MGDCDKCSEHCLECNCKPLSRYQDNDHEENEAYLNWLETEEGKKQLMKVINRKFYFHKDGRITNRDLEE